jgi:hypothetical protein
MPATIHPALSQPVAPERLSPLAPNRSDKGLILPVALRAPKGITKTIGAHAYSPFRAAQGVFLADPSGERVARSGRYEPFVTQFEGAR